MGTVKGKFFIQRPFLPCVRGGVWVGKYFSNKHLQRLGLPEKNKKNFPRPPQKNGPGSRAKSGRNTAWSKRRGILSPVTIRAALGVVDIGRKTEYKKTMFSTPIFNKTASETKSLIVQGDFDKIVDIDRTLKLKVSRKCFICMESFPCYGIFPLPGEMLGIERFKNGEENDLSIYHKSVGTFP